MTMTDFAKLMPDVARALLGEPNPKLTKGDKWRYRNKGSLSINVKEGRWHDFEADTGGLVLDLIERECQTDRAGAIQWLKDNGHLAESPTRRVGRFKRRSSRPTQRHRTRAERPRAAQKPKDKGKQNFALKLWRESEEIGELAEAVEHPFWMWATTGDKPNVLHPFCRVPPAIRWHRHEGGVIVAGVFTLSAWGKDGKPDGEPVAVQALAIDQNGQKRRVLTPAKNKDKCDYGPVSAGVFLLGDPNSERVSIVEGVGDALAVYSRKPGAVLATLGSNVKLANMPDVIDWLCTKQTLLYSDPDSTGDQGVAALVDSIKSRSPDAVVREPSPQSRYSGDPGDWAKDTPFPEIDEYDFIEKSGIFHDSGLAWGEADRMAVLTFLGRESNG